MIKRNMWINGASWIRGQMITESITLPCDKATSRHQSMHHSKTKTITVIRMQLQSMYTFKTEHYTSCLYAKWGNRTNVAYKVLRYDVLYKGSQVLPATKHEPYLPLLPSRRASPPFDRYLLRLLTEGWPGWVDLGGWLDRDKFSRTESGTMDTVNYVPVLYLCRNRTTSLISRTTLYHYTTVVILGFGPVYEETSSNWQSLFHRWATRLECTAIWH